MLLQGKKILIMGIRNKWSIAWGAAQSAYEQGAQIIFTYNSEENKPKIEKLMEEIPGSKAYSCNVSSDESIKICFETILKENGKIDGILHAIAHANTEDLRNDFINTSRDGFSHACDISSYSLIAVSRIASELGLLNNNSSIVTLSYYGAEKNIEGYNVMGIAKAALESSVRYLTKDLGKNIIVANNIDVIHDHAVSIDKSLKRIKKYDILKNSQYYFEKTYNHASKGELFLLKLTSKITRIILLIKYMID